MLTREEILSKTTLKTEKVHVKEWGGDVIVSEMTGAARDAYEQEIVKRNAHGDRENVRAKLLIATLVDESGNHIFSSKDINAVGALPFSAIEQLCAIAAKVNGFTTEELDNAEKN